MKITEIMFGLNNNSNRGLYVQIIQFFISRSPTHVPRSFPCSGTFILKNTIEDFKNADKKLLLQNSMKRVSSAGNSVVTL